MYVIGAGASHGESLKALPGLSTASSSHAPPMISGFFDKELLDLVRYLDAEHEFGELLHHIRAARLLSDPFGEGAWKNLNLEEILTAVEVEREFQNPESDHGANLLVVRNGLIRYIRRIIGLWHTKHSWRILQEASYLAEDERFNNYIQLGLVVGSGVYPGEYDSRSLQQFFKQGPAHR